MPCLFSCRGFSTSQAFLANLLGGENPALFEKIYPALYHLWLDRLVGARPDIMPWRRRERSCVAKTFLERAFASWKRVWEWCIMVPYDIVFCQAVF